MNATNRKKISQQDVDRCQCAAYHSGNSDLELGAGRATAECQGCGTFYTASQIWDAIDGRTHQQPGQGGVMLVAVPDA